MDSHIQILHKSDGFRTTIGVSETTNIVMSVENKGTRKVIVVSAVNLVEGGTLSVLQDCLLELSARWSHEYDILALVHKADIVGVEGVRYLEYPLSKRSWFLRLYFEYFGFKELSKAIQPELWLSLHDTTPNVVSRRRAVYCHNPSPFYRISLREAWLEPKFFLFNLLYRFVYRINISKNDFVIVQQEWLRQRFREMFGVETCVVAHPDIKYSIQETGKPKNSCETVFFFPSLPRVFKNIEIIGEAARILEREGRNNIKVLLTIDGAENRYSRWLHRRYGDCPLIVFLGRVTRDQVYAHYGRSDCLIFPSRLETWGMPLTEFKAFKKPILAADLPYAHETIGNYGLARFFSPDDPVALASLMIDIASGNNVFDTTNFSPPAEPYAKGWRELFEILIGSHGASAEEVIDARR